MARMPYLPLPAVTDTGRDGDLHSYRTCWTAWRRFPSRGADTRSGTGGGKIRRPGERYPGHPVRHAAQVFEHVVPGADASEDCAAGASRLPNDAGLVYKVLGMETEPVKAKVRAFWDLVRKQVTGAPIPAARSWGPPLTGCGRRGAEICQTKGATSRQTSRTMRSSTQPTRWTALPGTIRWTAGSSLRTDGRRESGSAPQKLNPRKANPSISISPKRSRTSPSTSMTNGRRTSARTRTQRRRTSAGSSTPRAPIPGRAWLVAEDEAAFEDDEAVPIARDDLLAQDEGIDGGGAAAEEAAVHLVDDDTDT